MATKKSKSLQIHDPDHILLALACIIFLAVVIGFMMGRADSAPKISDIPPVIPTQPQINDDDMQPAACTSEAMICPDGTYVGRVGPNCEFSPCP